MQNYRDLKVWEKAHALVLRVYEITEHYPRSEQFGLVTQLRRAAASVPTNLAEGCGRSGRAEFAHLVRIALGSATETEYLLFLSSDLCLLGADEYRDLADSVGEVKRMLWSLHERLRDVDRQLTADN